MFWNQEDILSDRHVEGEIEALQTDIQRFVAILGFCLMAIFALVQAIPVTSPEKDTVIEDVSHKLDQQNEELDRLATENQQMQEEIDRLMSYADITRAIEKQLDALHDTAKHQKAKIEKLIADKVKQEKDIVAYKSRLDEREKEIRDILREKARAERKLADARKVLKAPESEKDRKPKDPSKTREKQGIYVAFESDEIFMDLLKSGKIHLYIRILNMEKGFRAFQRDGRIDFSTAMPSQELDLWELSETMIPSRILEGFRAWTTLSSHKKMLIVGLTPEISSEIRNKKVKSGRFIIRSGGQVTYSR